MTKSKNILNGKIKELSVMDAAYIAGIIDADGCVTVSTSDKHRRFPAPLVIVTNSNIPLLDWLKETIGAGTSYRQKSRPKWRGQKMENWNPIHRYQLTGWKAIQLLEAFMPYLRVKRERAQLVIQMPIRIRNYRFSCPDEKIAEAKQIAQKIKQLNARGRKPLSRT